MNGLGMKQITVKGRKKKKEKKEMSGQKGFTFN